MSLPSQSEYIENHMQVCEAPADFQCSICQCDNTDEVVKVDHPGHLCWFHKKCLMSWFNSTSQQRGSCPNDRIALFDPTALIASQLDSPPRTPEPAVIAARGVLYLMQNNMVGSNMEIAFNYHMPSANQLRVDAGQIATNLYVLPDQGFLASTLRANLVEWAGQFMRYAPHEIQHDLDAVQHHIDFLQSHADTLSEDERGQMTFIWAERNAIQHDLTRASHTNGMPRRINVRADTEGDVHDQFMVCLANSYADRLLAVMDRARALILEAGTFRLRVEHDSRVTRATSPAALRLLGVEEPDENDIALAQEVERQFEDVGLDLE